jgi:hypothetical protein
VTAPAPAAGDVLTAVARADREWCRDRADDPLDQERREHLAAAVRTRLTGQVDPASAAELSSPSNSRPSSSSSSSCAPRSLRSASNETTSTARRSARLARSKPRGATETASPNSWSCAPTRSSRSAARTSGYASSCPNSNAHKPTSSTNAATNARGNGNPP